MASTVDDISINYEEDGVVLVKQLDKVILSKGAWATVIFKYQDWDRRNEQYGTIRFAIRRYQKRDGQYSQKSKFNISSVEQAKNIIKALGNWVTESET